jgi:putative DNA methylase
MTSSTPLPRKKLIEVAFPFLAVGDASFREIAAFPRFPDTLYHWWTHQPLALCRAALFAAIIDDPDQSDAPETLLQAIDALPIPQNVDTTRQTLSPGEQRRQKVLGFIEHLVQPESLSDAHTLNTARTLVRAVVGDNPPPIYDPFAGSGSIPLEAQRLGLTAHASDLNPVAALMNRALIELPPRFAGLPPVSASADAGPSVHPSSWRGAQGLAADVRFYGAWMRDEAQRQVGHLFPMIELPSRYGGGEAPIVAWIWASTLRCPNPGCSNDIPLVRSFVLDSREGRKTWVVPRIGERYSRHEGELLFDLQSSKGLPPAGTVSRQGALCPFCGRRVSHDELRAAGVADQMSAELMAIVVDRGEGPIHLEPSISFGRITPQTKPAWTSETRLTSNPRCVDLPDYGFTTVASLFTSRQLAALTTLSDLIGAVRAQAARDAERCGDRDPAAYADAVATYLGLAVCKTADVASSQCRWNASTQRIIPALARRTLWMNWEYAEGNPFSVSSGGFLQQVEALARVLETLDLPGEGKSTQQDAADLTVASAARGLVCTEPPHSDSLPLAELSDFFYAWLQPGLKPIHPDLFAAPATPKGAELVADPSRHGGSQAVRRLYAERFRTVCERLKAAQHTSYPLILFYPSGKDADSESVPDEGEARHPSVFLDLPALLSQAGLKVVAAWDIHPHGMASGDRPSLTIFVCR